MIFITVGSQKFPFDRLLKKVDELVEQGKIYEKIFAQIGVSNYKPRYYPFVAFTTQTEFNKKLEECDLVITHAGTGAIINALKRGKKVIAIPRLKEYNEHVDNHQIQLIQEFEHLNFIEPVYEISELEQAIKNIKIKKYNKYISNTDAILQSIKKFIDKECR